MSTIKGKGIANLRGDKDDLSIELKASQKKANEQAFDLYFRVGEIQEELLEHVKMRDSEPAVKAFLMDHVNHLLEDLRTGVNLTEAQRKLLEPKLHARSETTYLNVIASLLEIISGESDLFKNPLEHVDQATLINHLTETYIKCPGISKSNLEKVFPRAKRSMLET